jgi:hypothetical protein
MHCHLHTYIDLAFFWTRGSSTRQAINPPSAGIMQYDPSWTPDLPPVQRLKENMYFTGMFLANIALGASITLGIQCLALLRSTAVGSKKARRLWTTIVFFILAMEITSAACGHTYDKMAFIEYRNFPGGPGAWLLSYWL